MTFSSFSSFQISPLILAFGNIFSKTEEKRRKEETLCLFVCLFLLDTCVISGTDLRDDLMDDLRNDLRG